MNMLKHESELSHGTHVEVCMCVAVATHTVVYLAWSSYLMVFIHWFAVVASGVHTLVCRCGLGTIITLRGMNSTGMWLRAVPGPFL